MKKLLFVIPTLRMGGAEKSLVSLLTLLNPEKFDVDLLLFEAGGVLQKDVPDFVHIYEVDPVSRAMILEFRYYGKDLLRHHRWFAFCNRFWSSVTLKIGLAKKFDWPSYSKYISPWEKHYDFAVSYLEGRTAYYLLDKVNADRKIGWIHTSMADRVMSDGAKKYYERFDKLVTISEACKRAFVEQVPSVKDRMTVIENASSKAEIRRKAQTPADFSDWTDGIPHIVTVGRLEHVKGIDLAIDAANILKLRGVQFQWLVYGEGILRNDLQEQIRKYGLGNQFKLMGLTVNPYSYMNRADLIVQTSRYEGKSIVLDEAKLLGKAIVVTNYYSVKDQIQNERNGLVAEINAESIASCIEQVLRNSNFRNQLETECSNEQDNTKEVLNAFLCLLCT